MIVRRLADRLQLMTQPDHAHLAGTIMESCVSLRAEPRRDAILRAIYAHDNGWLEEDQAPQVNPDTGEMLDFVSAPLERPSRGLATRYRATWQATRGPPP